MRTEATLLAANRRFYDALWTDARLIAPERFNTWPLASALASSTSRRLEVAPGLRPRLPLRGTHFVDVSLPALAKLRANGGNAVVGLISCAAVRGRALRPGLRARHPRARRRRRRRALGELARVAAPGAALLASVPLHASQWTAFDDFVGHQRRYEPAAFVEKLRAHGFALEQSAVYGMQPRSSRLVDLGSWYLVHQRARAMWWYNRVMMPLGVRFQKKLALASGMIDTDGVDEVLLVCRRV